MTGEIRNSALAGRAKEYVWRTVCKMAEIPRGIEPTDVDALFEINRCFFFFEGKTAGAKLATGQRLCFERLLSSIPANRSVFVVGEHPPLDSIDVAEDLTRIRVGYPSPQGMQWHPWYGEKSALFHVFRYFRDDSARGSLHVHDWHDRYLANAMPFEGDAA